MGGGTLQKGIRPEVNIIARVEFELAYYDVIVKNVKGGVLVI